MEYVELNDIFINQNTAAKLDDKAEKIVQIIDEAKLISKYKIRSRFDDTILDIDKLSAGCKTVLNVVYNPDKVFCLNECGTMKSKPIVTVHFFTVHTSFIVNFKFTNNITVLTGDSGTGKTASFSFIKNAWL